MSISRSFETLTTLFSLTVCFDSAGRSAATVQNSNGFESRGGQLVTSFHFGMRNLILYNTNANMITLHSVQSKLSDKTKTLNLDFCHS